MSLSADSATGSSYATSSWGGSVLRAVADVPGDIVDGVEAVGGAVGDAASATVSFSARALEALASGGEAVLEGAADVVTYPFELLGDAAVGVGHGVEACWDALSDGAATVATATVSVAAMAGNAPIQLSSTIL